MGLCLVNLPLSVEGCARVVVVFVAVVNSVRVQYTKKQGNNVWVRG